MTVAVTQTRGYTVDCEWSAALPVNISHYDWFILLLVKPIPHCCYCREAGQSSAAAATLTEERWRRRDGWVHSDRALSFS